MDRFEAEGPSAEAPAMAKNNVYSPLNPEKRETRIVRVHPGEEDETVCATLVVVSIPDTVSDRDWESKERPLYEAISYTWGATDRRQSMILNGWTMSLTASAVELLCRFRSRTETTDFWIDAISINQDDLAERASQVTMMGSIYETAVQTRIWQGDEDVDTEAALDICNKVASHFPPDPEDFAGGKDDEFKALIRDIELPYEDPAPKLDSILRRPWYTRVWVVQEAIFSQNPVVYLGVRSIPWVNILLAANWLNIHYPFRTRCQDALFVCDIMFLLVTIYRKKQRRHKRLTLYSLMLSTGKLFASERRDHVYALLSLAKASKRKRTRSLVVRYDAPINEVMAFAVKLAMYEAAHARSSQQNIATLLIGVPKNAALGPPWPSWLGFPEAMTGTSVTGPFLTRLYSAGTRYTIDMNLLKASMERPSADSLTLPMRGYTVDEVAEVLLIRFEDLEQCLLHLQLEDRLSQTKRWMEDLGAQIGHRFTSREDMVSFLSGDVHQDVDANDRHKILASDIREPLEPEGVWDRAVFMKAFQRVRQMCHGNQLFRTKRDRLGIGHANAEVGDQIVILCGVGSPFTVRRHGEEYQMVGRNFVRGIMNGEALDECEAAGRESEVFVLR